MKADNKVTHGLFDVPQMRVEHGDQAVVDQGAEKTKVLKYKPRAHHSSVDCVLETRALIPIKLSILSEFLYFADSTFCL